jgi:hypothetical protein
LTWDDLDTIAKSSADNTQVELNKTFLRVFETEDGAKLMEYLRVNFLEQPVAVAGVDSSQAFFREGQNSIIREFQLRSKRAKEKHE